jgi:MFS family permease
MSIHRNQSSDKNRKKRLFSFDFTSPAFTFVFMMGIVNLFGDMTYEGGASINGQFMTMLGATALAISITAGLGEFLGYALRPVAGYIADKTGRYWSITVVGYTINLLAVPAMVFAGNWPVAAGFLLLERIGRAIRKPTVEAMLSYTTAKHGRGGVYGFNTAMDEIGATLGPLLIALVLFLKGSYQTGYAILLISCVLALISLAVARKTFPVPSRLEEGKTAQRGGFSKSYWLYMAAGSLFAVGMMSYELVAFHLTTIKLFSMNAIPLLLAFATGSGVIASLVLGKLYDRFEMRTILGAVSLSALFSPFLFCGGYYGAFIGLVLLGIAYATQDTLLKAIIAGVLPEGRRNFAFGLFYLGYGGGWLVGSIAIGFLYRWSFNYLVAFLMIVQLLSLPLFFTATRLKHVP